MGSGSSNMKNGFPTPGPQMPTGEKAMKHDREEKKSHSGKTNTGTTASTMVSGSSNLKYGFPTPGPQNPTGEKVMEHLFFLSESEWRHAREEKEYDIVIVGSGLCSLAVAERAVSNDPNCHVLIVERGTLFLPEHFQNLPQPFSSTLGGLSETFPWTLTANTYQGKGGIVRWQHGMVPFFGGRSTVWSAWCPKPTKEEMYGWPQETIKAADDYYQSAKDLLCVQRADEVDAKKDPILMQIICRQRPVYGMLQRQIQDLLDKQEVEGIYRVEPAPLASNGKDASGIDFLKYSVPGELLSLVSKQAGIKDGARLDITTNCTVEKIYQQNGTATALQTSRGVLPLGDAKLVLAMGTLPPTTLVRNSFPDITKAGDRFSGHFITSVVARVLRADIDMSGMFGELEIGAFYIAGKPKQNYKQQYHIQLSVLSDKYPEKNAGKALRYMPDVVATASMEQLLTSQDHVIFVCAVLGELDAENQNNWFHHNKDDPNPTTNSILQVTENYLDMETWNAMDEATFGILEEALSPKGASRVEYWHGTPTEGEWMSERPSKEQRRVDALVHESSTMHIGEDDLALVDLDYCVKGTSNVYVTGGALWPWGGSWNPTLTMVGLAQHLTDQLVQKKPQGGSTCGED